jgi:ABC-2 type transport system ATP-binding protein
LLRVGNGLAFPLGADQVVTFEAAHSGIHRAAREAGHLHDAESIDVSGRYCLKNHGGSVGEFRLGDHERHCNYVAIYLTMFFLGVCCKLHRGMPVLEVQHLYRSFRTIPAVVDVSFKVGAGEIVGFLGPNGAGKSTTVKIITGMLRPDDGKVMFERRNIRDDMEEYRAVLGYVPEEAHLYTYLSGLEYLQLVGRLRGIKEALIEAKATELLKLLNLESWQYSPISSYSKGMRQRVLIAAALLHDPKMLIFDEPLSGLDVISSRLFKDLLEMLAEQGKAVLYISHVLETVEQVCDRVIVIAKGRVLADAAPEELKSLKGLPSLESVFAQLVEQQDTRMAAERIVEVMRIA